MRINIHLHGKRKAKEHWCMATATTPVQLRSTNLDLPREEFVQATGKTKKPRRRKPSSGKRKPSNGTSSRKPTVVKRKKKTSKLRFAWE